MKKRIILLVYTFAVLCVAALLFSCGEEKENSVYLKLINKENSVDAEFVPEELVYLDTAYTNGGKTIQLDKTVSDAVMRMLDDMKAAGIDGVSVTSGYRTYEYQKKLFDGYFAKEAAAHPDWSEEQIRAQVLTYSAAPGTSEHQSGLCVDLFTTEMEGLWNYGSETPNNPYDKGFAETAAFDWLCENAHKYGFILRFPENKTDVTGYSYESWHYRYVGEEPAEKIYAQKLTLEEYLGR